MKRKKKEENSLSFLEKKKQVFDFKSNVEHDIFSNIPDSQKVTEKTERGTRVLVARYPDFYKIYFSKFLEPGTQCFPRGAIKVWNSEYDQMQYFYLESVAIHPDGGKHRFYERED